MLSDFIWPKLYSKRVLSVSLNLNMQINYLKTLMTRLTLYMNSQHIRKGERCKLAKSENHAEYGH